MLRHRGVLPRSRTAQALPDGAGPHHASISKLPITLPAEKPIPIVPRNDCDKYMFRRPGQTGPEPSASGGTARFPIRFLEMPRRQRGLPRSIADPATIPPFGGSPGPLRLLEV